MSNLRIFLFTIVLFYFYTSYTLCAHCNYNKYRKSIHRRSPGRAKTSFQLKRMERNDNSSNLNNPLYTKYKNDQIYDMIGEMYRNGKNKRQNNQCHHELMICRNEIERKDGENIVLREILTSKLIDGGSSKINNDSNTVLVQTMHSTNNLQKDVENMKKELELMKAELALETQEVLKLRSDQMLFNENKRQASIRSIPNNATLLAAKPSKTLCQMDHDTLVKEIVKLNDSYFNLKNECQSFKSAYDCEGKLKTEKNKELFEAVKNSNVTVVKNLLQNCQNPDATVNGTYGKTPLHEAADRGHYDILKELLIFNANVNQRNDYNTTPIIYAARNGHIPVIEELIKHGANVNAVNAYNESAMHFALLGKHNKVVELLKEAGAAY